MIPSRAFANKTVAVFGLARTGLGAVRALVAGGTRVLAWDDNAVARDLGGQDGALEPRISHGASRMDGSGSDRVQSPPAKGGGPTTCIDEH